MLLHAPADGLRGGAGAVQEAGLHRIQLLRKRPRPHRHRLQHPAARMCQHSTLHGSGHKRRIRSGQRRHPYHDEHHPLVRPKAPPKAALVRVQLPVAAHDVGCQVFPWNFLHVRILLWHNNAQLREDQDAQAGAQDLHGWQHHQQLHGEVRQLEQRTAALRPPVRLPVIQPVRNEAPAHRDEALLSDDLLPLKQAVQQESDHQLLNAKRRRQHEVPKNREF
mmetsp:Transcript_7999/g.23611  ORF Transcript_7999/g.23611 Transcript_7999/m.23611 type:complete len:221 (+) Transcript_7999:1005-1667(+)